MNEVMNSRPITASFQTLTIGLFLTLLWLPTLDFFLRLDYAAKPEEKRVPASWPQFAGLAQTPKFLAGAEAYFNDHFGFRNRLIRWCHHWKSQIFHDPTIGGDVLIGRDGWLFYSGGDMVPHYLRESKWTEPDLEKWRRLLGQRRDWLQARGIKYLFVVPPDKQSVYPENLPDWLPLPSKPSKIQQLDAYMSANSTVTPLDLQPALLAAKKTRVDYLKTDTHWNAFGAFAAYHVVMDALSNQLPSLRPLPADYFHWETALKQPFGDLATLLDLPEQYRETEAVTPLGARPPFIQLIASNDPVRFAVFESRRNCLSYTFNPNASGKAIVFHDSFAEAWKPFLGQHFGEVIYVSQYRWDYSFIEREKPDVVIDEMLERYLNLANPLNLAKNQPLSNAR